MVAAVDVRGPDGAPLDPARRTGTRICREAIRRGALLRPLGDTLYLYPPLNTSDGDIAELASILADSIDEVMT